MQDGLHPQGANTRDSSVNGSSLVTYWTMKTRRVRGRFCPAPRRRLPRELQAAYRMGKVSAMTHLQLFIRRMHILSEGLQYPKSFP